jgi:hypothetical protein
MTTTESSRFAQRAIDYAIVAAAFFLITIFSFVRLRGTQWQIDFGATFAGIRPVLGATLLASMKVWSFWALLSAVGAGILLKFDPEIDFFDALLGGACGAWIAAYVLGEVLGPIGLFRAPVIWLLLIAGAAWIIVTPTRGQASRMTVGQTLAMLALGLAVIGLVLLELGSPVAPYMDVLATPASVQRMLSFGRYLPFDSDPYGSWGSAAQTPGLELFLAMLAMGSRVSLGVLAQSAAMVPIVALIIFATYRLGAATIGDIGGGIAALMLFFTSTFRRSVGVRGTAVDFALVAAGLAFFLDRRSRRTMVALGALILGTSIAVHAIDGGFAIAVAAIAIVLRDATRPRVLIPETICLVGAVLMAGPEFAIGTRTILPYPILPLLEIAGIAVIMLGARALPAPDETAEVAHARERASRSRDVVMVATFAIALIFTITIFPNPIFSLVFRQFPILSVLAAIGLLMMGALRGRDVRRIDGSPIVIALTLTLAIETIATKLAALSGSPAFQGDIADLHYKLEEYWTPFFLVFPAALPFAIIFRRGRRAMVVAVLLAILIYPWTPHPGANYDYEEHSIAEDWGLDFMFAARGYWALTPDSRWTMGPNEMALVGVLNTEQQAGRITMKTHILHLAQDVIVWHLFNRFSVFTGVNDDPIVYDIPASDVGWLAGGRVRRMLALAEALAARPPYILVQVPPPAAEKFPPSGYDKIFDHDALQLYRRNDLVAQK